MAVPAASAPCSAWNGPAKSLNSVPKPGVKVGDRVMGSGAAAFAEYTLADHGRLFHIPSTSNMSFEEAATYPVALATMHNAVVTNGGLQPGQSVLIQGASSGVGSDGNADRKAKGRETCDRLIDRCDAPRTLKRIRRRLAVNSFDPGWVDQVLKATDGKGVDLIVDQVSGKVANQNLAATRILGRIVNVGRLGGTHGDFNLICMPPAASTISASPSAPARSRKFARFSMKSEKDIWPAVKSGKLKLPIDKVYPFGKITEAFERMEANKHLGKIVVMQ